jgi:hypothetical protein
VDGSGAATWPEKTIYSKISTVGPDPHGKVSDPCIYGPDLRARSRTSTGTNRTPGTGPGPLYVGSGPLTAGSRDSKTKNTQALIKARRGSGVRLCSPLRRSPDAATWPTARDVSQRAERDVRPLGRAAAYLSILLADGRRPGHLAGNVPVHSVGRQYARAAAYTMLIMTRALPRKQRGISILYAPQIL